MEPPPPRNESPPPLATAAPLPPPGAPGRLDLVWKASIVAALVALAAVLAQDDALPRLFAPSPARGAAVVAACVAIAVLGAAYFTLTLVHALRYRAAPPPSPDELPVCSVVVPAYNEGAMVRVALVSALESGYPADRLHVVAVDDGSTDDTWSHIRAVADAHPGRVTALRLPRNRGKRAALCAGFRRARGEVLVTVDSDSRVERDAIRHLVAPLVRDREVAAVAGKVVVLNRYANILTRVLAARFFVTFDLSRAAQSRFGAVLCTPGALSAYRREAVARVLEAWATQTFLGAPCTIGEDRALTTWLLRAGHRSVYQSTAVVHTLVPTALRGVMRMFVRWERGNIREALVMLPVLATRWRTRDRWWPTLEVLFDLLSYPAGYLGLALLLEYFVRHPTSVASLLASATLTAFVQSLYCLRSERGTDFLYAVAYAFFAFVGLQWVFPYSLLTVRNGRWLTR